MKDMRHFLIGMTGTILCMADVHTAQANRKMVVLIDATGSMRTERRNPACAPDNPAPVCQHDPDYPTRFIAAKQWAIDQIDSFNVITTPGNELGGVRVFIFHTLPPVNGLSEVIPTGMNVLGDTPGWYTGDAMKAAIFTMVGSSALPGPIGDTPLAYSMCKAADKFQELPDFGANTLLMEFDTFTDGGENSSQTVSDLFNCYNNNPSDWQQAVRGHLNDVGLGIPASATLFTNVANPSTLRLASANLETAALTRLGAGPAAALLSDEEFFRQLASDTGGTFRVIHDNDHIARFADVNGDFVVDRDDAILVARHLGQPASTDPQLDLNKDGVIGFDDYQIVVNRIKQADPYVPRDPVSCHGSQRIVIDGQAIENAGITIDARGSCQITIKNSLIVSGNNAIKIVGNASLTIDNSIVVGRDAVITQNGASVLSAANSVFHGRLDTQGAFQYIDRGGNVFE